MGRGIKGWEEDGMEEWMKRRIEGGKERKRWGGGRKTDENLEKVGIG